MAWEFDVPQISKGLLLRIGKNSKMNSFPSSVQYKICNIKIILQNISKEYKFHTNKPSSGRPK